MRRHILYFLIGTCIIVYNCKHLAIVICIVREDFMSALIYENIYRYYVKSVLLDLHDVYF